MSHCKAILVAILSFWSSSFLMGMDNPENNHYSNVYIPKFLWWSKHDLTDKYGIPVPKEIKDIIVQKGCDLHGPLTPLTKKYFRDPTDWVNLGDEDRMSAYKGERILIKDFDLISMNDEGKNVFGLLAAAIPYKKNYGTFSAFVHPYTGNSVSYSPSATGPKIDENHRLLTPDEYDKILKLPLALRRKVGDLCTVKVVGEGYVPLKAFTSTEVQILTALGFAGGGLGGGIWSGDHEALHLFALTLSSIGEKDSFNRYLREQEMKRIKPSPEGIKAIGIGCCTGALAGCVAGLKMVGNDPYNKICDVTEKPIITSKEKSFIKKADLVTKIKSIDKPYNNELEDLQLHLTTMKEDWNNKSETEKDRNREAFNENHTAIEQEIESLKNHRMEFAHSNMKTSDFEELQSERNAIKTKEIWDNLPWYKQLFHVGTLSDLNPDVQKFNKLQEKHHVRRAIKLQKQQQQQKLHHE